MDIRANFGTATSRPPLRPEDLQPRFAYGRDGKPLRIVTLHPSADLTSRGVCVLLHGLTEFIEKYLEVIGDLLDRGYTVATMDWRGQGGSFRALDNPLKAHIEDFRQHDSDLQGFMDKVVHNLTDRPPIALAHSMGANILLRSLHDHSRQFSAAVLSAPMLRALTGGYPPRLARFLCRAQNFAGRRRQWVQGAARDPLQASFAHQAVTSDSARFARTQSFLQENPHLRLAGPTWGWLEAAYRSMEMMQGTHYAEAIKTPVLMLAAGRDRIVDTGAIRNFARRLPHCRYEEIDDAEHEILMENDAIRARFWAAFDDFTADYI